MTDQTDLIVRVQPPDGAAASPWTGELRAVLLDLDVADVRIQDDGAGPAGGKAAGLAESLAVKLGLVAVRTAVEKIREWAGRSGRSVKITIDGDALELTGATTAQQQQLLEIWLARHAPRP